ncbi:4-(cytidine 5'-diphospho)-2-C-methyl-D-erythritol kinase [Rubellicoccus peritrichatus]|uniref:4-diphosphocytidyl-2-C-methyl-D-erythritol kinase n=1 Tax=Rubellicoccus peritrichatus TaxID=3080537 RepID=A0AAQ3L9Y7_9BACT|nr:4-(cytidine 5'-diphospho)-2-C-methyl-D-erythritol kinase [Puniceicoccus sp. CR14]WOO41397.1 4-(cytidine 5'-diphospho)-2-C-methyl-D-erythritol kinase [Puniceicoccus sp. CR14]
MKPVLANATEFSPAKVNLYLAITGAREDGFHELLSLVAPLDFGDDVSIKWNDTTSPDRLTCNHPEVPTNEENLVLRAAKSFREVVQIDGQLDFTINKRIPPGAGLGGGSSNAAAALLALNRMFNDALDKPTLLKIAAKLGSDCPLFLENQPVVMSGRGEIVEPVSEKVKQVISGQSLVLIRPDFGVSTIWAYKQMRAAGSHYIDPAEAQAQLDSWLSKPDWTTLPLVNNLQTVAFQKHLALPTMLDILHERFGLRCMMSGSGSSCFALPSNSDDIEAIRDCVTQGFGGNCLFEYVKAK